LIEEAYNAGFLDMVFYVGEEPNLNIEKYEVTEEIIKKLSDVLSNQGIIGVCHFSKKTSINHKILLLDGIQDPGNMGTLIRSAVAFDFQTIILDKCVDIYNPKVIRATQGALFKINIIDGDIIEFIKNHRDVHFYVTDLSAPPNLEINQYDKIGLVLGNEGQGVRKNIIKLANSVIKLKMKDTESLNVAIAGSILMYELGGHN